MEPETKPNPTELRDLVMSMYDVQHTKILQNNRYASTGIDIESYDFLKHLENAESNLKTLIRERVKQYRIHLWIVDQKGIKHDMAGQMIGLIGDISKFDNISKLWAYAGMGVIQICKNKNCGKKYLPVHDRPAYIEKTAGRLKSQWDKKVSKGVPPDFKQNASKMLCHCEEPQIKNIAQRRIKGVLLDYNPQLKSLCWRFGKQFIMQGDFYRSLYDKFRAEYEARPDLIAEVESKAGKITRHGASKGTAHINAMAQRKMEKIFLQHLWTIWRKAEGLTVTMPYIIEKGGHTSYIAPPPPEL